MDAGANVTVIEHREEPIRQFAHLGATLLRGSTSVIPAKTDEFDLAISFHYLHETDPFFHAQIVSELARVARRIALVEPAPPADPLGKRIKFGTPDDPFAWWTIAGVVGDIREYDVLTAPRPTVYLPVSQADDSNYLLRTADVHSR